MLRSPSADASLHPPAGTLLVMMQSRTDICKLSTALLSDFCPVAFVFIPSPGNPVCRLKEQRSKTQTYVWTAPHAVCQLSNTASPKPPWRINTPLPTARCQQA